MKTLPFVFALLLAGCANISHVRQITIETTDTNGVKVVRTTRESEAARFLMQKEAAGRVYTSTSENATNYTHRAGAINPQASGDSELARAIAQGAVQGAVQGAK